MLTGTAYHSSDNPLHIHADMQYMVDNHINEIFVAAQEVDFIYFHDKLQFTADIAKKYGIKPTILFWGALNLFGGGRSSQHLLYHPEGFQKGRQGEHIGAGCYVNPVNVRYIQSLVDEIVPMGYAAYMVDEPTLLTDCFCDSCVSQYRFWHAADLFAASEEENLAFRKRCAAEYIRQVCDYSKANYPVLETQCVVMPVDRSLWADVAQIETLDTLGTDMYWVWENDKRQVSEMKPMLDEMNILCKKYGKNHQEWVQCWEVKKGLEPRIYEQGQMLIAAQPDSIATWGYRGCIGTIHSCEDPVTAWEQVLAVFRQCHT